MDSLYFMPSPTPTSAPLTADELALITFFLGIGIIFLILALINMVLWAIALVHVFSRDFETQNEKLLWGILIIWIPFLGPLLYLLVGRKRK